MAKGKIISFAWTMPAFLARRKSVTRRQWSARGARRFCVGDICQAWNKSPRATKAKDKPRPIGTLRIISVTKERLCSIPETDYEAEGLAYLEEIGCLVQGIKPREFFDNWRESDEQIWVVRFEILEVFDDDT